MRGIFQTYYQLTKPGIIYGNLLTTAAGFFLASRSLPATASRALQAGTINFAVFFAVMIGTGCIIGSACVFNNYIDRKLDAKMMRTQKRGFVTGKVSVLNAFIFATVLGLLGVFFLGVFTNFLTVLVGVIGFIDYVVLYGISKRKSIHGTLVGAISGAMPIVAGYTAVTNRFDLGALLLFLVLGFWQMPHFYAIGIYRLKDYANASIPILPVKKGILVTKLQMLLYVFWFVVATLLLSAFKFTGFVYAVVIFVVGLCWLGFCIKGFWMKETEKWARTMFFLSLIVITVFSIILILTPVLW